MENWITAPAPLILEVVASVFLLFLILIILTRISGLRTFSKMSSIDFATTIAVGSILASIILNQGQSLLKGSIAIAAVFLFQSIFSSLLRKSKWFKKKMTNKPLLLMKGENILYENLAKANVSEDDLMAKLREANIIHFSEVKAVVFETTGDVSVLHGSNDKEPEELLLKNVKIN